MRVVSKLEHVQKAQKFQMGGTAPEPDTDTTVAATSAPNEGGGEDPMLQILQIAAQAVQTQNCEAAIAVCQALLDLVAQSQGGAPAGAPQEPTFARKGARIVRVK